MSSCIPVEKTTFLKGKETTFKRIWSTFLSFAEHIDMINIIEEDKLLELLVLMCIISTHVLGHKLIVDC